VARKTDRPCVALIADVVHSRRFTGSRRARLQESLSRTLGKLNRTYSAAVLSKFIITTGDEFQGLLHNPVILPDLIWDLEQGLRDQADLRLGVGHGTLETAIKEYAVGMDGPVWHRAREAVVLSKSSRAYGGVFAGFGAPEDDILNGLARLLRHVRERLSDRQLLVLDLLRRGFNQKRIAERLNITKQAVSKQAKAAGWEPYQVGEVAFRAVLTRYDFSRHWRRR